MAESADVLTQAHQQVLLPDLNAGCSMADMADIEAVEEAWAALGEVTDTGRIVPITYMNSAASLKAFVGRHGGAVCTSSNARAVLTWRSIRAPGHGTRRQGPVLPDQHLGRNTAFDLGYAASDMAVWNPRLELGVSTTWGSRRPRSCCGRDIARSISGSGPPTSRRSAPSTPTGSWSCTRVRPRCRRARRRGRLDRLHHPGGRAAPAGSVLGIGTEIHLVKRLADEHPDKTVVCLDPLICPCSTMFRIDAPTSRGCSRGWSTARYATASPSTPRPHSGHGSRSSACSPSPETPPGTPRPDHTSRTCWSTSPV